MACARRGSRSEPALRSSCSTPSCSRPHQLQAAFEIGGALMFACFHGSAPLFRRCRLAAFVLIGLLLSHLWPYYDPIAFSLIGDTYTFDYKTNIDWTSAAGLLGILWLP